MFHWAGQGLWYCETSSLLSFLSWVRKNSYEHGYPCCSQNFHLGLNISEDLGCCMKNEDFLWLLCPRLFIVLWENLVETFHSVLQEGVWLLSNINVNKIACNIFFDWEKGNKISTWYWYFGKYVVWNETTNLIHTT